MLYRFHIELSDIDRGVYESLDFRLAQHPSETAAYLLSRVLAYALSYQPDLEFSPGGLGDPEAPALRALGAHGNFDLWIEIGNPSSRKLHKATKTAKEVRIYTYKSADVLREQIRVDAVHRGSDIQIYAVDAKFLSGLETRLEKNNHWSVLYQQGRLDVQTGGPIFSTDVTAVRASSV